jgi:CHAT domain
MPKVKVLIVSANSVAGAKLKVDAEYNDVASRLAGKKNWERPSYHPSATWEAVIKEIKEYKPNVVHFSAHGSPSKEIILNDENDQPKAIPTRALEQLFHVRKGNVRLVVMNSCFSAHQAKAIAKHIDCVVGVKLGIVDDTATKFSPIFYEALAEGQSVAAAYDDAMISVYSNERDLRRIPRIFQGNVAPEKIFLDAKPRPRLKKNGARFISIPRGKKRAGKKPVGNEKITIEASVPEASAPESRCESLHWCVKIDEEGDAYNELNYQGIVLPPGAPYLVKLPPAEVQSGHTSEFELIADLRTTVGTSLEAVNIASTRVEMNVKFANRPMLEDPARFAISCWDWNVYSMNMEEFRDKPHFSDTTVGVDYAQKFVPATWKIFFLTIQFPPQMVFATTPYFEIYHPPGAAEKGRNDELTHRYQYCLSYSPFLKQATLSVQEPPSPFCYRISWRLDQSHAPITSPLTGLQRHKQRAFADSLLAMRRNLETPGDGPQKADALKLAEGVKSVLVSVAEYAHNQLEGAELDDSTLEISLIVLDQKYKERSPSNNAEYPVLRIAAGNLLEDPAYRKLYFFVGDGNAGRAWKHRMARVYDLDETDPKHHIYIALPNAFRHRFLISIPLIDRSSNALMYGILNFGTSSEEQAELLRKFGRGPGIEDLTTHAQSYVLKRLKELIRMS